MQTLGVVAENVLLKALEGVLHHSLKLSITASSAVSTYAALRVAFAVRAIEDFIHIHVLKYLTVERQFSSTNIHITEHNNPVLMNISTTL